MDTQFFVGVSLKVEEWREGVFCISQVNLEYVVIERERMCSGVSAV